MAWVWKALTWSRDDHEESNMINHADLLNCKAFGGWRDNGFFFLFLLFKEIGFTEHLPHWSNVSYCHSRATPALPAGRVEDRQEELSLALLCLTQGERAPRYPWNTKSLILLVVTLPHIHQLQRNPSLFIPVQIKANSISKYSLQIFSYKHLLVG